MVRANCLFVKMAMIMASKKHLVSSSLVLGSVVFVRHFTALKIEKTMAPAKKKTPSTNSKPASITNFFKSPKRDSDNGEDKTADREVDDTKHESKRLKKADDDVQPDETERQEETENGEKGGIKTEEANNNATTGGTVELDIRPHFIGGHVSAAGGVHNALIEACKIGASSCAFFLRPPKNFNVKPLSDEAVELWQKTVKETQFDLKNIVVHAPYLINIGSPNGEALERSRNVLFDDLQRCDRLGIKYYNIHPGSTLNQISAEKCCQMIAESVNMGLKKTKSVVLLLENMAGQGNWMGSNLKELGKIIDLVEDKERIGVCLDTCHAFAYGYGINSAAGMKRLLDDFEKHVGLKYLKAVHVNDSKGACGDNKDRHEDIGKGVIGKAGFKIFMNEPVFRGIPLILETPGCDYAKEINLLHSMASK